MSPNTGAGDLMKLAVAAIIGVVAVSVVLSVGASLGAGSSSVTYPTSSPQVVDAGIDDVPGTVDVRATTGRAVRLTDGATVDSPGPIHYDYFTTDPEQVVEHNVPEWMEYLRHSVQP